MTQVIRTEYNAGEPIQFGNIKITPFAKSLNIQVPGWQGGLIWNRPSSILVSSTDGEEIVLPVIDVTRQVLCILVSLCLIVFSGIILFSRRK